MRSSLSVSRAASIDRVSFGASVRLELEPQAVATAGDEEVELGAGVGGPEPGFPGPESEPLDNLLEGEALEARAHFRMGSEIPRLLDAKQGVQQPAVGDVDLG